MPEEPRVHLAICSRFENIELVQVVLNDALEGMGIDDDTRHWVGLAVREAVANAIKHGNRQDPGKQVEVDWAVEGSELIVRVRDEGEGFDAARLDNPLAPENLLKPNGRGIFYMKSFMDRIDYGSGPDGGTEVTLRKRMAGRPAEASRIPQEGQ
ncbi:MAG TPA: ATP-binding protein [Thermoanaerobaculia bacterium]|nr:ATP-binding protein [Thermoanaerobaculia bacterium]